MSTDVIIVGGGIIGCSIALELASAGLKVTIIERGKIGCESSRAAAGMLSPHADAEAPGDFFDLCVQSRAIYPGFAENVRERSGIDPEYDGNPTLSVALDRDSEREIKHWAWWQIESGLPLQQVSAEDIRALEPEVTQEALNGVLLPDDHRIDNRRLMDALAVAIRRAGVEVREDEAAIELLLSSGAVSGLLTRGGAHWAGSVVMAAGCWSGGLLDPLGLRIPMMPAHGQMLALAAADLHLSHVVHARGCYLVPRRDGRLLVGATVEYTGYTKRNTAAGILGLLASAAAAIPRLSECELLETWSGLRPDTADHLPVIGPSGIPNLWIATGHFRNGILLAAITAALMRQAITSGSIPMEMAVFGPQRFCTAV